MKHIIQPSIPELARYTCDVTGAQLPNGSSATITIRCGYASPHDGSVFELHLSANAAETVLPLIRALLLNGAPLEPNRTEVFLNEGPLRETTITRGDRATLMRRLKMLIKN